MIYLYCYDIADPKRWRKVSKRLEQFGLRVQKSIFQCDAPRGVHARIIRELRAEMNRRADSLRVYPLCKNCGDSVHIDGTQPVIEISEYRII